MSKFEGPLKDPPLWDSANKHIPLEQQTQLGENTRAISHAGQVGEAQTVKQTVATTLPPSLFLATQKG